MSGRPGREPGRAAHERGAGTVLVLGATALVLVVAYAAILVAQAATARHRAGAAADLAALAAARAAADNVPRPCRAAAVVASRNRADLTSCRVAVGGTATVTVRADGRGLSGIRLRAAGSARARPTGLYG